MPSTSPCAQRVSSCEEKEIEKEMEKKELTTDILIIGGGTAGCYAAVTAARRSPKTRILVAERIYSVPAVLRPVSMPSTPGWETVRPRRTICLLYVGMQSRSSVRIWS